HPAPHLPETSGRQASTPGYRSNSCAPSRCHYDPPPPLAEAESEGPKSGSFLHAPSSCRGGQSAKTRSAKPTVRKTVKQRKTRRSAESGNFEFLRRHYGTCSYRSSIVRIRRPSL